MFLFSRVHAQIHGDTLRLIYQSLERGDFNSADAYLNTYEQRHPNNTAAMHLHADVYTYMGRYKEAETLYSQIIRKDSTHYDVICSYADLLAIKGQYSKAIRLLDFVLLKSGQHLRAGYLKAKINYWRGDNNKALRQMATNPNQSEKAALQLKKDVILAKAPVLNYRIIYASDNQPVQSIQHLLNVQQAFSSKWNPQVQVNFNQYDGFQKMQSKLANTFKFPDLKMDLRFATGIYNTFLSGSSLMDVIWEVEAGKSMLRYWKWEAYIREKPYLYNMHSLKEHVLQRESGVALNFNHAKGYLAKASYQINAFRDNNAVSCFYFWGLIPITHHPRFKLSIGYGFNYSDTREVRFKSPDSTSTLISNFNPNQEITGRYYPYFTPMQQTIQSVLAGLQFKMNDRLMFRVNASYGFAAKSQLPYVYLDNVNGEVNQHTGTALHTFTPYDFSIAYDYKLGNLHTLGLTYEYVKNNFYTDQQLSLSVKMLLTHEK